MEHSESDAQATAKKVCTTTLALPDDIRTGNSHTEPESSPHGPTTEHPSPLPPFHSADHSLSNPMATQSLQTVARIGPCSGSSSPNVHSSTRPDRSQFSQSNTNIPPTDSPLLPFIYGHYTLSVCTSFGADSTTDNLREASLTLSIGVDTRLPELDLYDHRSAEAQEVAFLQAGDSRSHTTLRRYMVFAERLEQQMRNAFDIPAACILTLTLPAYHNQSISPLHVIISLAMHLRQNPHLPSPRRARLLDLDTDELITHVHSESPSELPAPPSPPPGITYMAHINFLDPERIFVNKPKSMRIALDQPNITVAELIDDILESWSVKGSTINVVLAWPGAKSWSKLPEFMAISEEMFVEDMARRGEGQEVRFVGLTGTVVHVVNKGVVGAGKGVVLGKRKLV